MTGSIWLERHNATGTSVLVSGDLIGPSRRRTPIAVLPEDWEALETALTVAASARVGDQWCECDAMRPVVEAARACVKAMELRVKERYEHWADSPWLTNESKALFAAVDALDGTS